MRVSNPHGDQQCGGRFFVFLIIRACWNDEARFTSRHFSRLANRRRAVYLAKVSLPPMMVTVPTGVFEPTASTVT